MIETRYGYLVFGQDGKFYYIRVNEVGKWVVWTVKLSDPKVVYLEGENGPAVQFTD